MATEDFTSANWNNGTPQANEDNKFSVDDASTVTATSVDRADDCWHYRTHTVSGDYEWLCKITHNGYDALGTCGAAIGSDGVGDLLENDNWGLVFYSSSSTTEQLYIAYLSGGSWEDEDSATFAGDIPHVRYITMDRTSTTLTAKIYTDEERTSLEDTISCACPDIDVDYIYSLQSRNSTQPGYYITCSIADLDLQEAAAGWSAGNFMGVANANISKICGVAKADISKVGGV